MRVTIFDDKGDVLFTSDGDAASFQSTNKAAIAEALDQAAGALDKGADTTITSISADIRACVARIERELGGHPAFTWAQTTLGWAEEHLKQYVSGVWKEPAPHGLIRDSRGFVLDEPNAAGIYRGLKGL